MLRKLLEDAEKLEQQGVYDAAEGALNDALAFASKNCDVIECARCYEQLALFLERRGRGEEARSVKRIAALLKRPGGGRLSDGITGGGTTRRPMTSQQTPSLIGNAPLMLFRKAELSSHYLLPFQFKTAFALLERACRL
jgi:hypothetical protein